MSDGYTCPWCYRPLENWRCPAKCYASCIQEDGSQGETKVWTENEWLQSYGDAMERNSRNER